MTPRQSELAGKLGPAALVLLIAGAAAWTWSRTHRAAGLDAAGLHLKCVEASCGAEFSIPREEIRDYPRGPQGQGLRCQACERFSARLAQHCPRCGRWYAQTSGSDDAARCPFCDPRPASATRAAPQRSGQSHR